MKKTTQVIKKPQRKGKLNQDGARRQSIFDLSSLTVSLFFYPFRPPSLSFLSDPGFKTFAIFSEKKLFTLS
jgi:hypothetical protein